MNDNVNDKVTDKVTDNFTDKTLGFGAWGLFYALENFPLPIGDRYDGMVLVEMTRAAEFLSASSARTIPPNMSVTWLAHRKKEDAPEVWRWHLRWAKPKNRLLQTFKSLTLSDTFIGINLLSSVAVEHRVIPPALKCDPPFDSAARIS